VFAAKLKSLLVDPLSRLLGKESRGLADKFVGTAGTLRAGAARATGTDELSLNGFHRLEAIPVDDFVPGREVTFRPSQVVSERSRAEQRFKKPALVVDYPVGDATHMQQWAKGKYVYDGEDHGYNIVRPDDVQFGVPTRDGWELDTAPWVRRWPPEDNTFVRSRSLTEPVNAEPTQAPDSTPGRQRLLTVKTGRGRTETVAVDDETLLKVQAANNQLAQAAQKNAGPVVLLPDKSFPSSADEHIENLRTSIGSPEMYVPTGDVSTTIGEPRTALSGKLFGPDEEVVPGRTGIEVHKADDSPAWQRLGAKPGTREWWAEP
jgi:hypothetical protein